MSRPAGAKQFQRLLQRHALTVALSPLPGGCIRAARCGPVHDNQPSWEYISRAMR